MDVSRHSLTRFTSRVKTRIHQHESVVETQQGPADTAQIGMVFFPFPNRWFNFKLNIKNNLFNIT